MNVPVHYQCVFTIVHGTWGRIKYDPPDIAGFIPNVEIEFPPIPWYQEGSLFCDKLRTLLAAESVDSVFRPFIWSGNNSVFARDKAARELASGLKQSLHASNAAHVIIAHSHGGNVALRALNYLGKDASNVYLVTLATPFLRVFLRKPTSNAWLTAAFALCFFAAAAYKMQHLSLRLIGAMPETIPAAEVVEYIAAMFVNSHMLIAGILSAGLAYLVVVFLLNLSGKGVWGKRPERIAEATYYNTRDATAPSILVLRGIDDEASFALALGALNSRITSVFVTAIIPYFTLYATLTLLLSLVIVLLTHVPPKDYVGGYILLLLALSICLMLCVTLPGVFKSVFGREFVFGAMRCDIASDSTPDILSRVEVVTLPPIPEEAVRLRFAEVVCDLPVVGFVLRIFGQRRPRRVHATNQAPSPMRHAIYGNPAAVPEIVEWVMRTVLDMPSKDLAQKVGG